MPRKVPKKFSEKSQEWKGLYTQYEVLAKRANERLRQLELVAERENADALLTYAYRWGARAVRKRMAPSGGNPRFNKTFITSKTGARSLQAAIADIEQFLGMKTSTISGWREVENKRAKTLREMYGLDIPQSQIEDFFAKHRQELDAGKFGSSTTLTALAVIESSERKVLDDIISGADNHKITQNVVEAIKHLTDGG